MTKPWGWLALVVVVVAGYAWWAREQRHVGALSALTRAADSVAVVRREEAQKAVTVAADAMQEAETLRQAARVEVQRDRAVKAAGEAVAYEATAARNAALRVLDDSLATVVQLRAEVGRLVAQSRADSVAQATARQASEHAVLALLATLTADSTALARSLNALNAEIKARLASEAQVTLLKSAMPSRTWRTVERVAWGAAVVYLAARR